MHNHRGSYKCTYCEVCWPQTRAFERCPQCQEETRWSAFAPLSDEDAAAAAHECEFGWFLMDGWLQEEADAWAMANTTPTA